MNFATRQSSRLKKEVDGITLYQCSNCKIFKPSDKYSKNHATRDGINYWCNECIANYTKKRQRKQKGKRYAFWI